MASVELVNLSKSFGKVQAVRDVSLTIRDQEFLVFVGPSGCGKSTVLRMIAGLEEVGSGEIRIGGKLMNPVVPADRGVAMVFQSYALYPHMSARENIGFGLKMAGVPADEVRRKVADAASALQIEDLLDRRPRALSGGQRQRVAIGRAIVKNPDVFLFDEPLSNLDAGLRVMMRVEIARLHKELKSTVVYVTHDQIEAMTLADRIVVLNEGRIEQHGAPGELYDRPANLFVAGFLGQPKMNFMPATWAGSDDGPLVDLGEGARVPGPDLGQPPAVGAPITLGVRPDVIRIDGDDMATGPVATIELVEHLGNETLVHLRPPQAEELFTIVQPKKASFAAGAQVRMAFDPAEMHLFDEAGNRLT
ncbi:MAG: sn-glycerol-3-phosphate ABC transporter ATP-binding protein UgpC [Hyphomicrobiales bacterium]|nr:sn-glycerol-3-phosphate ABC transporter ATP-binding protein UgpC [Hyphomicrobiales bacterium]